MKNYLDEVGGVLGDPPIDPEETKRVKEAEALRLQQEAAAAERAAEIEATCDEIDAFMIPLLKTELEQENAKARMSAATRKVFERFKACCASWGLPALPAPPQAVAVFLTDKTTKPTDVERLAKQISLVHRAVGHQDPCEDILIRALLRQVREEKKSSPKKGS